MSVAIIGVLHPPLSHLANGTRRPNADESLWIGRAFAYLFGAISRIQSANKSMCWSFGVDSITMAWFFLFIDVIESLLPCSCNWRLEPILWFRLSLSISLSSIERTKTGEKTSLRFVFFFLFFSIRAAFECLFCSCRVCICHKVSELTRQLASAEHRAKKGHIQIHVSQLPATNPPAYMMGVWKGKKKWKLIIKIAYA